MKGCTDEAKDVFGAVVLEPPDAEVKEMLLKVKLDATYEANSKSLLAHEVKLLQETLKYLEINGEGLTKDGVVFSIMNKLFSLMPNKCGNCRKIFTSSSESREILKK